MKFIEFLKAVVTANTGISSKRFCGVVGWFICLAVLVYCAIAVVQAPLIMDTFILACLGLLGIDSVTKIWKKPPDEKK